MKVDVKAEHFYIVKAITELNEICGYNNFKNILVIGSGSNILFTKNFEGCVIKNEIPGIDILDEDINSVQIKVGAGINWHEFVMYAVNNNWAGIETLALIPGTVGAAPVQNIGAYGQEIKDVIVSLDAYELSTLKLVTFSNIDCRFSYRNSIFKQQAKNKYIITSVTFKLNKHFNPNLTYPALTSALDRKKITEPTLKQIMETVIEIRRSKLPDYYTISNCGSFFTNPLLTKNEFDRFIIKNPGAPFYPFNDGYKLSAGWLIEQCGWKGKRIGNVGCYERHALVIVNYGAASGKEILNYSETVRKSVYENFGITLDYEVNIL